MVSKIFALIASCAFSQVDAFYKPLAKPLVLMKDYPKDYRTLSCEECFKVQGKMCTLKSGGSMISMTGSSNQGHGLCCKPGFTGENCKNSDTMVCSQPSGAADNKSPFTNILTDDKMNQQMYAFCPKTTSSMCGIPDAKSSKDLSLYATLKKQQTITLSGATALQYKKGKPSVRKYDSCYYQILSNLQNDSRKLKGGARIGSSQSNGGVQKQPILRIYFQVTKNTEMNVFIYGGNGRNNATQSVISNNQQAQTGMNYTIDVNEGMFVVAYPNEDATTEFEFKYWVEPYDKTVLDLALALDFNGPDGMQARILAYVVLAVIVCILLCICGCICRCMRKTRENDKVMILAEEEEMDFSKTPGSRPNQTSIVHLESSDILRTEDNENSKATLKHHGEQIDYDTDKDNTRKSKLKESNKKY